MKTDQYPSVKIDFIDQQHAAIFDVISDLSIGISKDNTKSELRARLLDLTNQCCEHFDAEENFLNEYHFPDIASHINSHNEFRKKLIDLIKIYDEGRYELSLDTIHFLSDWLMTHIGSMDKIYEPYIHNKIHTA